MAKNSLDDRYKTQEVCAVKITENSVDDVAVVPDLLGQIEGEIERFLGDSGYDKRKVYRTLSTRKIQPCIPPRKNAKLDLTGSYGTSGKDRNAAIRSIQRRGSEAWKRRVGYHRRSLAETAMFRLKKLFGERLKNRKFPTQQTETAIKIKALNKMTSLGLPVYLK